MKTHTIFLLGLSLAAQTISVAAAEDYDVVILNGRVMDPETQFDGIRNVGIKDGNITTITKEIITGAETIDATGHVVAPGFIDTQAHSQGSEWGVKVQLRDGVTTPMDFEIGAINVAAWYTEKDGKWQANFGTVAAHEYHRMRVLDKMPLPDPVDVWKLTQLRGQSYQENGIPDWAETVSDLEQLNAILKGLDDELRDGALGIGSTMGYMANGVTTFEMWNVQKVAANYDRTFAAHVRHLGATAPPSEGTLGGLEQIANGVALNQPTLLSHNNNYGWWEIEERLQMLRAQGYNAWSEYYPYTAGSTTIGSEFLKPENIEGVGMSYERMFNPQTGKFMSLEEYERIVADDPGFIIVAFIDAREPWLPMWLRMPHMVVASDAMPPVDAEGNYLTWDDPYEKYSGHPRTAGTYAKVLRLAREHDVSLMHILAQTSYWSAKHLGDAGIEAMKVRGRMQEGMVADITIFDPKTVTDNSTYKKGENGLPSTGIPFVLVNGTIVVKDSKVQKVFPGQPIRYPIEAEGRFKPLERDAYIKSVIGTDYIDLDDETMGEEDVHRKRTGKTKSGRTDEKQTSISPQSSPTWKRASVQIFDPLSELNFGCGCPPGRHVHHLSKLNLGVHGAKK